jgi:hypothetical protein
MSAKHRKPMNCAIGAVVKTEFSNTPVRQRCNILTGLLRLLTAALFPVNLVLLVAVLVLMCLRAFSA